MGVLQVVTILGISKISGAPPQRANRDSRRRPGLLPRPGASAVEKMESEEKADISTLEKTGHLYFGPTSAAKVE
jgi:hypothetical protein